MNRLPQTESRYVVLIALTAERIPAALLATVGADRSTTVGALRYSGLSAWHPNVVISEFNLTGHYTAFDRAIQRKADALVHAIVQIPVAH